MLFLKLRSGTIILKTQAPPYYFRRKWLYVDQITLNLSITNTLIFERNEAGIKKMFEKDRTSRDMYYSKVQQNEDTKDDFFKE